MKLETTFFHIWAFVAMVSLAVTFCAPNPFGIAGRRPPVFDQ